MITTQENHFTNTWWEEVKDRFHCAHERQQLVRYQQSNGQWRARRQCLHCGEYTTSDLAQRNITMSTLPKVDEALRDNYRSAKQKAREDARYQHLSNVERQTLSDEQKWQANYNAYLNSEHWRQLRRMALHRDNFRCQNCFQKVTDANAHVHHLSYTGLNRVGKSFAFECVTLCAKCHIAFHPRMQNGR